MKILWMNWSGGGNLPPSLGIARVLTERGHDVSFAGRPEMVGRVQRWACAPLKSREPTSRQRTIQIAEKSTKTVGYKERFFAA